MARTTVEDLFIHELSDIYSAEKQIKLKRMKCVATEGLVEEGKELLKRSRRGGTGR